MHATTSMEPISNDEKIAVVERAIKDYRGDANQLEKAIGVYFMGHHMGWKFLHLAHSRATIKKYESILGLKFKDSFPELGVGINRSIGWKIACKVKDFWEAARGQVKGARDPNIT